MLDSIFGGGNILGTLLNIASMVFPALQMANALFNMLTQAVGQAIKQAIDQLIQQGLPKFIGDAIKGLVDQQLGGNQRETTAGAQAATQDRYGNEMQQFIDNLANQIVQNVQGERERQDEAQGGSSAGAKGWLRALAQAFGKIADAAAQELKEKGENINKENPSDMLDYQALAQEFNMLMQTFTNAIKTIGEADANAVRKT